MSEYSRKTDQTHMANEHLLRICAQLQQQGKQPSVGLVKSRAGSAFQLAAIIAAVQFFKANPDWQPEPNNAVASLAPSASNKTDNARLLDRITSLEAQVAQLEKSLNAIQKQLNS